MPSSPTVKKKISTSDLFEEVKRTLPAGIELLRPLRYEVPLQSTRLEFLVLKVFVPSDKEASLQRWVQNFEDTFAISVWIERVGVYKGIRQQLEAISEGGPLLTNEDLPQIQGAIERINQTEPAVKHLLEKTRPPKNMRRLTHIPFITIDPEHTKDREDAFYAAPRTDGGFQLKVAIVDATWLISPGSAFDKYAQRLGATLYGSRTIMPTLGKTLAFGPLNLQKGRTRVAWIFDFQIAEDGNATLDHLPFQAIIRVSNSFSPEEVARILETPSRASSRALQAARDAAVLRFQTRCSPKHIIRKDGEGIGALIVAECMILTKHWAGKLFSLFPSSPAIYRVHASPTAKDRERFTLRLHELGIPAVAADFEDPLQLAGILQRLQTLAFEEHTNAAPMGGASHLADEILRAFLTQASFDANNKGHHALGLDAYVELKPRDASGLTNQFQLAALCNPKQKALSRAEIDKRVRRRVRCQRQHDWLGFKLRFFEMLARQLPSVGARHIARVAAISQSGDAFLEVAGFRKWGALPVARGLEVDQQVIVQLQGFNIDSMRFEFAL